MKTRLARMARCADRVAAGGLLCQPRTTAISSLSVRRSTSLTAPELAIFHPTFYLLLQGRKSMIFGDRRLEYTAGRYAVSSVGIPFRTQVTQASCEVPYLGVELALDSSRVAALLLEMPLATVHEAPPIDTAQADDHLLDAVERLLRLTASPDDVPVLAPLVERELYYRLLTGPVGGTLRQVVPKVARFQQIKSAVEWISQHANEPMQVAELAASVGLSTSSLHRHFKAVTNCSPLAYQRLVRLLNARELLAANASNVTAVASAVGYLSPSQFSREYKRLFGVSPSRDIAFR